MATSTVATTRPTDQAARLRALEIRALEILRTEIGFIPNPEFRISDDGENETVAAALGGASSTARAPDELPAHLRRICETELLTHEREVALFREMNRLKYCANVLRTRLDPEEWAFEQEDDHFATSMSDQVWSNLRELTASMLDQLDRRERFIIRSRFALGAHRKVRTLQSLANKLGVSKERVRQIEQRAVSKLGTLAEEFEMDELFGGAMV